MPAPQAAPQRLQPDHRGSLQRPRLAFAAPRRIAYLSQSSAQAAIGHADTLRALVAEIGVVERRDCELRNPSGAGPRRQL